MSAEPTTPTVFIVDDDEAMRDALSMLMRAAGLRAETFASAKDFLHHCTPRLSGCLLLDIRMPEMSGLELQAELHKRRIHLPIVFLTGHGDVPMAVRAMKDGAVDFIQKPVGEHRLVMAVMKALKTDAERDRLLHGAADLPEDASRRLEALSEREREVLQQVLRGRQNREIAVALNISVKTVEFHRANIREKLGVGSLQELFSLVYGELGDKR
ncbi:MAG: response regulator [Sulfuritalea sp.]|nr:response regulator [Sulfuritalea sp.]